MSIHQRDEEFNPIAYSPVSIEQQIQVLTNRLAKSIPIRNAAYERKLAAKSKLKLAEARAYMRAEGSIPERTRRAIIETETEQIESDAADAAYKHAEDLAEAIETELSALQSISRSIQTTYANAGRGIG